MPQEVVAYPLGDFSGGINDNSNPTELQPNELGSCLNWWWFGTSLQERPGLTKFNSTALAGTPAITGLVDFVYGGGGSQEFVCTAGAKAYKAAASSWTDITGAVTITAGQNNVYTFATFQDTLIGCNGVDVPWKWTGSGNLAALGGIPPTAKYIATLWNYLFMAGISTDLGLVRYADLNTFEIWSAGNTIRPMSYGSDYITGLVSFGDMILVLCRKSLRRIGYDTSFNPPFVQKTLVEGVGCPHQRAFVNVDDKGYFIDQNLRVRAVVPSDVINAYDVPDLSTDKIPNTLAGLDLTRRWYICGTYYRPFDTILWSVTTSGASSNNYLIILNLRNNKVKYATFEGINANAMAVREVSTGHMLYLGDYSGFVHRLDGNSDNGTAITGQWDTAWLDYGSPKEEKTLRRLQIEASQPGGAQLVVDFYRDYRVSADDAKTAQSNSSTVINADKWGTTKWGSLTWPSGTATNQLVINDLNLQGHGFFHRFRVRNANIGPRISVYRLIPLLRTAGKYGKGESA